MPSLGTDFARALAAKDFDRIGELLEVEESAMADRGRISYRFRGHNEDGDFVVEQQAYLAERDGRIA